MDEQQTPNTPPQPVHQAGTGKGEEILKRDGKEAGRIDTETSETGRPSGTSTARDSTGVNPTGPIDPNSPTLPTP